MLINCAAYTAVDACETETDRCMAVNAHGPAHLAAACAEYGCRLIHISTDYVFDGYKDIVEDIEVSRKYGFDYAAIRDSVDGQINLLDPLNNLLGGTGPFGSRTPDIDAPGVQHHDPGIESAELPAQ